MSSHYLISQKYSSHEQNIIKRHNDPPHNDYWDKEKRVDYTQFSIPSFKIRKFLLQNFLLLLKVCGLSTLRLLGFFLCIQYMHTLRKILQPYPLLNLKEKALKPCNPRPFPTLRDWGRRSPTSLLSIIYFIPLLAKIEWR